MQVLIACCAGLDVHKDTVVACVRRIDDRGQPCEEVRTFGTMTSELIRLGDWLEDSGCTIAVIEATGVYWKPVWQLLAGRVELVLANAHEVRNVPGRKTDMNDAMWLADLIAHGCVGLGVGLAGRERDASAALSIVAGTTAFTAGLPMLIIGDKRRRAAALALGGRGLSLSF